MSRSVRILVGLRQASPQTNRISDVTASMCTLTTLELLTTFRSGLRKKCAHCIKYLVAPKPMATVEPMEYACRFADYFRGKFTVADSEVPLYTAASGAETGDSSSSSKAMGTTDIELNTQYSNLFVI